MSRFKLGAVAGFCATRPWTTVAAWIGLLAVALTLNVQLLGDALTAQGSFTNQPESLRAQQLLEERLRGPDQIVESVIVRSEELTVDDPAFAAHVDSVAARLAALGPDKILSVLTYSDNPDPALISEDRHATIVPVVMAGDADQALSHIEEVMAQVAEVDGENGFRVLIAGSASIGEDFMQIAEQDALTGETVGVGVALVILVLVFGAMVAAAIPVVLAGVSVVVALGLTALLGQKWDLAFTVTNVITMMGLAVGIDYSLFIVSRFREERLRGLNKTAAIVRAQTTAGRAVLFSGMTVIVALLGLFVVPSTVFRSMAAGAVLVVGVAVLAAMTLLPAVLGLLGDRINRVRIPVARIMKRTGEPGVGTGFWDRLTRRVMARPVVSLVAASLPLLLAAGFYLELNPGAAGASTLPDSARTKEAFRMLEEDFSFAFVAPVEVVMNGEIDSAAVRSHIDELKAAVARHEAFAGTGALETNEQGDLALLTLPLAVDPNSEQAEDAVRWLRDRIAHVFAGSEGEVLVGGDTAINVDFFAAVDQYTPWVFLFVLGLSFVLLMMVFRSLIVPVKAILMNLLSVGAAYGLLVLVFQRGVGAEILGFEQTPRIEAWLPLFLFSILFGLSMDYHVLLLSRIRERYDETGRNAESVAFGLRSTAGLITGAAVIMVAVFGGFAAGDLVMFQQLGFGLAVAVLLDATVVRSVLVPATMKLLGSANWWLPRPLGWLPDLRVEPLETVLDPVYDRAYLRKNER